MIWKELIGGGAMEVGQHQAQDQEKYCVGKMMKDCKGCFIYSQISSSIPHIECTGAISCLNSMGKADLRTQNANGRAQMKTERSNFQGKL